MFRVKQLCFRISAQHLWRYFCRFAFIVNHPKFLTALFGGCLRLLFSQFSSHEAAGHGFQRHYTVCMLVSDHWSVQSSWFPAVLINFLSDFDEPNGLYWCNQNQPVLDPPVGLGSFKLHMENVLAGQNQTLNGSTVRSNDLYNDAN